jgi:hypothetical protein
MLVWLVVGGSSHCPINMKLVEDHFKELRQKFENSKQKNDKAFVTWMKSWNIDVRHTEGHSLPLFL